MKLVVSLSVVVLLAVHLTFAADVDLDRLRQFLKQRALNSQRYVGEPPEKSRPAPLAGEPAGPQEYVYKYEDQPREQFVNEQEVRGVPEDEYIQAQRQLSPDNLQEYQEPQNIPEEGPLIQQERLVEDDALAQEAPVEQQGNYEPGPQDLNQRALNSQRYVGEPPEKSRPAPLAGEPAGPQGYVYQYEDQPREQFVNEQEVRGVPEDEYIQAQRQLSPDNLQEYQEPQNIPEEGPLIQQERLVEDDVLAQEALFEQQGNYEPGPQEVYNGVEPYVPNNEERAFEEPQGVNMNDDLEQQERRMMEEESQRMEMEEQIMAQQRELEAVQSDEDRLESIEIRGINEQLEIDEAEALEQRATKEGDGKVGEKPAEKPAEKPTEKPAEKPAEKPKEKPKENPKQKPKNDRISWQRFLKQQVVIAEKFERAGPNDDFKKFAVVVTVENGRQYFIRKLVPAYKSYGRNSRVQVVDAELLSSTWTKTSTKDVEGSTIGDYLEAAKLGRSSYEALAQMWKLI